MSLQIDNGDFTRIHNDILDGLAKSHFAALEFRCLFFLIRMTYGWQKKEDAISLSQWATGIGIDDKNRGNILNTLNGLVAEGVIYMRSNGNNRPATWGLCKSYFEKPTVISEHNTLPETVMQPHNSMEDEVLCNHITEVLCEGITVLPETVMQPHNHKRKVLKKELKKEEESSFPAEKLPTPQQEMFAAVCEAIGWDYHTLTKDDKGQVAQAVGIFTKNSYTVDDIRRFITEFWFKDWRWEKNQKPPTLKILRQEIGIIRSVMASAAPATRTSNNGVNAINEYIQERNLFNGRA
jgi:phage replication O-like protein O